MSQSRWTVLPPPPDISAFTGAGYTPALASVLYHRGLRDPSQATSFFEADSSLCGDPFLLPGMHEAVNRIYRALLAGEKIAVFGDFDADGVTATALMAEGLSLLGSEPIPYIPHRVAEGYGLKAPALERLRSQGVSLVISVDCGITAIEPVQAAAQMGLDIIVTDHHMPLRRVPAAAAVVDPKLPSAYPFDGLSGAGVALKVLQALSLGTGTELKLSSLFDLAALGTVADMVPLLHENRYLVRQGLSLLNGSPRTGILALMGRAGIEPGQLQSDGIAWGLAPRLNAAGRLEHAMDSYRLLTTQSEEEANSLADWLQKKNTERQELTTRWTQVAREQVEAEGVGAVVFANHPEFPIGICGLVASRLADLYYRPAVVVRTGPDLSTGSCRSIPEFDIIAALNACQESFGGFTQFGGHSQAAGFTLPTERLTELKKLLAALVEETISGMDLRPKIEIDAEVELAALGGDVFPTIQKLEPFGQGNPPPAFLSRNVSVVEWRTMGSNCEHLKMRVRQNGVIWDAVGFGLGNRSGEITGSLNIVYNLEVDHWNGSRTLRLNLIDFERANG